jgi:hypothetical protein
MPGPVAFPFMIGYNVRLKRKQVCYSMLVSDNITLYLTGFICKCSYKPGNEK